MADSTNRNDLSNCVPLTSETRHLFEYFMLSRIDVKRLDDLFLSLSDHNQAGATVDKLFGFLELEDTIFNRNFMNHLKGENGLINYYVFVKFALICSFVSTETLMINCYHYFDQVMKSYKIKPLTVFFDLYSEAELPSDIREQIQLAIKSYKNNFIQFILDSCHNLVYYQFFKPFYGVITCVSNKIFTAYIKTNIYNRHQHYDTHIKYYLNNNKFVPLSLCQALFCWLFHHGSPNQFDFYLLPEKRKCYKLPCLFGQLDLINRNYSETSIGDHHSQSLKFPGHRPAYLQGKYISKISTKLQSNVDVMNKKHRSIFVDNKSNRYSNNNASYEEDSSTRDSTHKIQHAHQSLNKYQLIRGSSVNWTKGRNARLKKCSEKLK